MKKIFTIALVIFAAIAATSCVMVEPLNAEGNFNTRVNGYILQTKASNEAIKNEWQEFDWIYVNVAGKDTYYRADEQGSFSSFSICGTAEFAEGTAYAIYPKSVLLRAGYASFDLNNQNGSKDNLQKYALMTAAAPFAEGTASFSFQNHIAGLEISLPEYIGENEVVTSAVLSGDNLSNEVKIRTNGTSINVVPGEYSSIEIVNPETENGNLYMAYLAGSCETLTITIRTSEGGLFWADINNAAFHTAGCIEHLNNLKWEGGYEICFSPTVAGWR